MNFTLKMPLYCDDVCSADSRKMIEEHLPECEVYSNMLHQLKSEYTVSVKEREEKSVCYFEDNFSTNGTFQGTQFWT